MEKCDGAVHNQSLKTFKTEIRMSLSSIKENCLYGCVVIYYEETH